MTCLVSPCDLLAGSSPPEVQVMTVVLDEVSGKTFVMHAKGVINATGPFSNTLLYPVIEGAHNCRSPQMQELIYDGRQWVDLICELKFGTNEPINTTWAQIGRAHV